MANKDGINSVIEKLFEKGFVVTQENLSETGECDDFSAIEFVRFTDTYPYDDDGNEDRTISLGEENKEILENNSREKGIFWDWSFERAVVRNSSHAWMEWFLDTPYTRKCQEIGFLESWVGLNVASPKMDYTERDIEISKLFVALSKELREYDNEKYDETHEDIDDLIEEE